MFTINNLDLIELENIINCIFIFGIGSSSIISTELNDNLIKLGFNSYTSQDFHGQLLFLNSFKNNDLIILFSKSGRTREILELIKLSKKNNIKTILITTKQHDINLIQTDYKILYYFDYNESTYFSIISSKLIEKNQKNIKKF